MSRYVVVVDELCGIEGKHLPGQHDQRTHGHRFHLSGPHLPVRDLLREPTSRPARALRSRARKHPAAGGRPAAPGGNVRPRTAALPRPHRAPTVEVPATPDEHTPDLSLDRLWHAHDLADLTDSQLGDLISRALTAGNDDLAEQLLGEQDRREEDRKAADAWGSPAEQEQFLQQLAQRPARKRDPKAEARSAYQDYLHSQIQAAEKATRGAVANAAGRAKGYGLDDFLTGRVPRNLLAKYASEELLQWLADNPTARMTESEWIAEYLGRNTTADREKRAQRISEFG